MIFKIIIINKIINLIKNNKDQKKSINNKNISKNASNKEIEIKKRCMKNLLMKLI